MAEIEKFLVEIEARYPAYRLVFGDDLVKGMAFVAEIITEIINAETKPSNSTNV